MSMDCSTACDRFDLLIAGVVTSQQENDKRVQRKVKTVEILRRALSDASSQKALLVADPAEDGKVEKQSIEGQSQRL